MSATPAVPRFARPSEAAAYCRFSKNTLWRLIANDPTFPRPLKAGQRVTLIDLNEVDAWLAKNRREA